MKTKTNISAILFPVLLMCFQSCVKEGDETLVLPQNIPTEETGNAIVVGSTHEFTQLSQSGYSLYIPQGAIPTTMTGANGRLAFSLGVSKNLPHTLPPNLIQVGYIAKTEPFNFIFNSPLTMNVPLGNTDIQNTHVYTYNEYSETWQLVPFSSFNPDNTGTINMIDLGYYVLAKDKNKVNRGGIRLMHPDNDGYFYTLTICSFSGEESSQMLPGKMATTQVDKNGLPAPTTFMPYVPKGTYQLRISREKKASFKTEPTTVEYYSSLLTVRVDKTLEKGKYIDLSSIEGWTDITPDKNKWSEGRPTEWGTPTKTYGTGKFQATLTWVNNSYSGTDYDLHLYGPNSLHVYYSNKNQGAFELDRDWLTEAGNAIENIYSVKDDFPKGNYIVKVHHYSGTTGKLFNCRIIVDGYVVYSKQGSIGTNKNFEQIYTFTVK